MEGPRAADTPYDRVPYVSDAILQTHPARLAALARLHGMQPAPPDDCRVLELGCGNGGNLWPMADILADSTFVGVDVSGTAVRHGRSNVADIGLSNVRLLEGDLRELDGSLGRFDYVIAHGVYSWVPDDVRDALMRVIEQHLTPQGVAYVSYNLLPGWHIDGISRDLMRFHVQGIEEPEKQAEQALAFLQLAADAGTELSTYKMVLEDEVERLGTYPAWFMLHDHLGASTTPVYFRDFVDHAASHGLGFLTEADYEVTTTFGLRDDVAPMLRPLADDVVLYQQYLDYLRGGRFRRTLLCHADVQVDRSPKVDYLANLNVAAPVTARPVAGGSTRHLVGLREHSIRTDQPMVLAVLDHLGKAWPATVAFDDLVQAAHRSLASAGDEPTSDVRTTVAQLVLSLLGNAFLEIRQGTTPVRTDVSQRPQTTLVARWQAGQPDDLVTNAFHRSVPVDDEMARHLLRHLDGQHTHEELAEIMSRASGDDAPPITDALNAFARDGLLIA